MVIALTGVAKTNGANVAAKVSTAIPVRAFKEMSAMIFLHRLWKHATLRASPMPHALISAECL
jgi:fatty-acid desaturase